MLLERHPVLRLHDSDLGVGMERENLCFDVKRKIRSGGPVRMKVAMQSTGAE